MLITNVTSLFLKFNFTSVQSRLRFQEFLNASGNEIRIFQRAVRN